MSGVSTLAYVAIVLVMVAVSLSVAYVASPSSPLRAAGIRHVAGIEKHTRALFLSTPPANIALAQLVALLLGLFAAAALDPRFVAVAGLALVAPQFAFKILRARRVKVLEEQLAGWLDILANMLRVSGSLADALTGSVALTRGPLGQELDLMLKELKVGAPLPIAGRAMAERARSPIFSGIMTLLMIGRNTGGEMPTLLHETAATLRERMRLEGVVRKHTAMGRAQIMVLAIGPWGLVIMFRKVEPEFFEPLFTSGWLGQAIMTGAFLLWLISLIMARKILKVEI